MEEKFIRKEEIIAEIRDMWEQGFPDLDWDSVGKKYTEILLQNLGDSITDNSLKVGLVNLCKKIYFSDGNIHIKGVNAGIYALFVNEVTRMYAGDENE